MAYNLRTGLIGSGDIDVNVSLSGLTAGAGRRWKFVLSGSISIIGSSSHFFEEHSTKIYFLEEYCTKMAII